MASKKKRSGRRRALFTCLEKALLVALFLAFFVIAGLVVIIVSTTQKNNAKYLQSNEFRTFQVKLFARVWRFNSKVILRLQDRERGRFRTTQSPAVASNYPSTTLDWLDLELAKHDSGQG